MSLVSLTLPSDGQRIDAADVNVPFNALAAVINGNLDSTNISSLSGTKIQPGTLPGSALDPAASGGWTVLTSNPNTTTYSGNRAYTSVFNGTDLSGILSPGMRVRAQRSNPAPSQCAAFNGSTQYYSKTSPSGMVFTDDFVVSAWIKLSSYPATAGTIMSRYNNTSGWSLRINSSGQVFLFGNNAGGANFSAVTSVQSVPLNKWVHVAAQLDMSSFTATPTTSYTMIDGQDVPATVTRGGTNPTSLVQAGDLNIGAENGSQNFFPGNIAQAAVYSAKVAESTIQSYISQGLTGGEATTISAYSFNNSINDLNTGNANNLSPNGSVLATNTDSPFAQGTPAGLYEYGIITAVSFSTNTTISVQVAEGSALPTTGILSNFSYSIQKVPYGFPGQRAKWKVEVHLRNDTGAGGTTQNTWYNAGGLNINIPVGQWNLKHYTHVYSDRTSGDIWVSATLATSNSTEGDGEISATSSGGQFGTTAIMRANLMKEKDLSLSAPTQYYWNIRVSSGSAANLILLGSVAAAASPSKIVAELATV